MLKINCRVLCKSQVLLPLLLALASPMTFARELLYKITPLQSEIGHYLRIELEFESNQEGQEKLNLPSSWTDADKLYQNIHNLRISAGTAKLIDGNNESQKLIYSQPKEKIKISYDLSGSEDHPFKPQINSEYFCFIGNTAFVIPQMEPGVKHKFKIKWNVKSDNNNKYYLINSFSANEVDQNIVASAAQFQEALYLGGKLIVDRIKLSAGNLYIVRNTNESVNIDNSEIQKIIDFQRKMMKEKTVPYYIFALINAKKDYKNGFAGTNLENTSVFFYDREWVKLPKAEKIRLVSHELYHYWIGRKIKPSSDYLASMWFFEGFTDYLATKFAYDSGLLKFDEYLQYQNRLWKSHYQSYFSRIKNRDQALYYWDNVELHHLPYVKGHLFAQYVDYHISQKNKNEFSGLHELIIKMLDTNYAYKLSEENLIQLLSMLLKHNLAKEYVDYFVSGKHFEPIKDLYSKKAYLTWKEVTQQEYGFDILQSFLENRAIGVLQGGAADKAGIKEGLYIKNMDIALANKKRLLFIKFINVDGEVKTTNLEPKYEIINVPYYVESD